MQTITITGYLSKDAESSTTQGGESVTRWNIPVKQGWGEREQTNWFRVSIWGKRAEFAAKAPKGEFATVTGELTIGEYNGKAQYEIRANDFQSVNTAPRERQTETAGGGAEWGGQSTGNGGPRNGFATDLDDDIPFIHRDGMF